MGHFATLRVLGSIGLLCCAISVVAQRRHGRLNGGELALVTAGLALWAIGLGLSFLGV
jgi:hypothetical protein